MMAVIAGRGNDGQQLWDRGPMAALRKREVMEQVVVIAERRKHGSNCGTED